MDVVKCCHFLFNTREEMETGWGSREDAHRASAKMRRHSRANAYDCRPNGRPDLTVVSRRARFAARGRRRPDERLCK